MRLSNIFIIRYCGTYESSTLCNLLAYSAVPLLALIIIYEGYKIYKFGWGSFSLSNWLILGGLLFSAPLFLGDLSSGLVQSLLVIGVLCLGVGSLLEIPREAIRAALSAAPAQAKRGVALTIVVILGLLLIVGLSLLLG